MTVEHGLECPIKRMSQPTINDLNQLTCTEFVATIGTVYEQTPAIAATAWHQRPFATVDALHTAMVGIVQAMSLDEQLQLIRAHPDLGSKAKMAEASVQEQASVGLDRLTPADYDRFHQFNQTYWKTFGFPFIIAVKHHTQESILAAFEQRLQNPQAVEIERALDEIHQIAWLRLTAIVS